MELRILGPLEVAEGGRQLQLRGSRERALLAMLAIHAGEVVSADRLIEELWGGDLPGNPANALQVVVSRVRKALEAAPGPGRLVTRKPGYVLDVRPQELDAGRFALLVEEARRAGPADPAHGLSLLEEALRLWRGPALAEFAAEGFAREEITRLEEERIRAVEMKAEAELALGRHARIVTELRALVAANPLRERLRGQLMLALYRSGRQGEALRAFQEGRGVLVEELGVDPGPELQDLHQQILLQAASLMAAPEAEAGASGQPASPGDQLRGAAGRARGGGTAAAPLAPGDIDRGWRVGQDPAGHRGGAGWPRIVPRRRVAGGTGGRHRPRSGARGAGGGAGRRGKRVAGRGRRWRPAAADKLLDYLRGKELLVVLDNCEHLVEACARLTDRCCGRRPGSASW